MLKLPSGELKRLIDAVVAKRQWTQMRLSQELNVGKETISRWRSGTGIHQGHYDELLRLAADEEISPTEPVRTAPMEIPFSVTIPRASLKLSVDKNGDFVLSGILRHLLDQKEE